MLHNKSKADLINRLIQTEVYPEEDTNDNGDGDDYLYYDDMVILSKQIKMSILYGLSTTTPKANYSERLKSERKKYALKKPN